MSATLVTLPTASPAEEPSAQEKRLKQAHFEAHCALDVALNSVPSVDERWRDYRRAADKYMTWLQNRVRKYESILRQGLAVLPLDVPQRAQLLESLFGPAGKFRDANTLTSVEAQLIADYRNMDAPARQMLRTLCERLAQIPAVEGDLESRSGGDDAAS
ncbi:MAG: hypothetical protein M3P18_03490 [Actinomycetota bacterium]|nr:hypothetical protein [Actinomycetota bacterium]